MNLQVGQCFLELAAQVMLSRKFQILVPWSFEAFRCSGGILCFVASAASFAEIYHVGSRIYQKKEPLKEHLMQNLKP